MAKHTPKIVVTSGEPAGIGPDICLALGDAKFNAEITVLGDPIVFSQRASRLNKDLAYKNINLISVNTKLGVHAGRINPSNAPMVLEQLNIAVKGCLHKKYDAMVTAPVNKAVINDYGLVFSGHTEYLARKCGDKTPVMMLACDEMRVALATTHLPLSQVESKLTQNSLIHCLEVIYNDLRLRFGILRPVIAVCGLNPHAGEQGHLGTIEQELIEPTLELARSSGMTILGPLPADTAFTPKILAQVDAVLTMYHDQGLPVLKYASFGKGVNITLGLPIIRTSVDHGTALDLAGSGRADPSSLIEAVATAIEMVETERTVRAGNIRAKKAALNLHKKPANNLPQATENLIPTEPSELNKHSEQALSLKLKKPPANGPIDYEQLDYDLTQFNQPAKRTHLPQEQFSDLSNDTKVIHPDLKSDNATDPLTQSQILRQNLYDDCAEPMVSLKEIGLIGIPEFTEASHIRPPTNSDLSTQRADSNDEPIYFSELDILKTIKEKKMASHPNELRTKTSVANTLDYNKKNNGEITTGDADNDDIIDAAIRTMTDIVVK